MGLPVNCKYLVAAALLAWGASSLSAQTVKAGIDAWQKSDYVGAVNIWRPLADKGDADAEFNLGQAYRLGRGVPINLAAAKTWFERAANQGHVDAETTLGLLLFQNGDQAEGLKWLKKAADQGEPRAQLVYGTALVNGDSVTQDPTLGYAYVSSAAASGLEPARDTLKQLDQILPATDRKRGAAMATRLSQASAKPKAAPTGNAPKTIRVAKARPAPIPAPKKESTAMASAQPAAKMPAKAPPPAEIPASGAWRIQLGAFSQRGSAEALYSKLSGKPALAGRRAFYIPVGAITRLQVGPFETKAAAEAACKSAGVPCFTVPAK